MEKRSIIIQVLLYVNVSCCNDNTKHLLRGKRVQLVTVGNPQGNSLLFAAVLLLLQPIQIEEVDPVFQIGGLSIQVDPFASKPMKEYHAEAELKLLDHNHSNVSPKVGFRSTLKCLTIMKIRLVSVHRLVSALLTCIETWINSLLHKQTGRQAGRHAYKGDDNFLWPKVAGPGQLV